MRDVHTSSHVVGTGEDHHDDKDKRVLGKGTSERTQRGVMDKTLVREINPSHLLSPRLHALSSERTDPTFVTRPSKVSVPTLLVSPVYNFPDGRSGPERGRLLPLVTFQSRRMIGPVYTYEFSHQDPVPSPSSSTRKPLSLCHFPPGTGPPLSHLSSATKRFRPPKLTRLS